MGFHSEEIVLHQRLGCRRIPGFKALIVYGKTCITSPRQRLQLTMFRTKPP